MFIVAPPQKKRHRWLRFFAGLAVVLIILIVVVGFVVTSPAFIKSVVLPRAGAAMNADITVSSVSFNPFKQIVLRDLKVQAIGQAPVFHRLGSERPLPSLDILSPATSTWSEI